MPYLVIRNVKGHHYAYEQESYREGGRVVTRTVNYLGPVSSVLAKQVKETRAQLGRLDMIKTQEMVSDLIHTAINVPERPQRDTPVVSDRQNKSKRTDSSHPITQMTIDGRIVLVDQKTGELVKDYGPVITTEDDTPPLRSFQKSLALPLNLERYSVNETALRRTHARYGQRLKDCKINPAFLPDIRLKYGHPDKLKVDKTGYTITASRKPDRKRHQINKKALWQNYRQALASGFLDAIEAADPVRFDQVRTALDTHYACLLYTSPSPRD